MTPIEIVQLVVAGAVGGMLRSLYFRTDLKEYFVNIIAGAAVARYLGPEGPAVLGWFLGDIVDPSVLRGRMELTGFLLGAGGVAVVGWFYDLVEARIKRRSYEDERRGKEGDTPPRRVHRDRHPVDHGREPDRDGGEDHVQ